MLVQQLMVSFDGHYPPSEILDAVRSGMIGAFCLFAHRNVESPAQVRRLTEALRQAAVEGGHPYPIIGIDQEGGQLIAIAAGATELPGNMALGATRSPELAAKAGYVLARELAAMGIHLDFAPALDVNVNPNNPVIGVRAFGASSNLVAQLGVAMIGALQAEGVMAAAKHFPGHGDTGIDSHFAVPVNHHDRERLEAVELVPFRAAIAAGVDVVLTAHVIFSAIDAEHPATQSSAVLVDLLRRQLGFTGLIITDAMDMYAASRFGDAEGVRRALLAGNDLALLAHIPDQLQLAHDLHLNISPNPDARQRINRARRRIPSVLPSLDVVGCAEHLTIAHEIADRSITLLRDNGQLPLQPLEDDEIAVITVNPVNLTPADTSSSVQITLADAVRKRHRRVLAFEIPHNASPSQIAAVLDATREVSTVVVATIAANDDPSQAELVRRLHQRGPSPIVIAMRTPYDLSAFPHIDTYLCAYSIRPVTCESLARVLFGEIVPTGVLPCPIPGIEQDGIAV